MAQAVEFLRFLIPSSSLEPEIRQRIITLSRDLFGVEHPAFLETVGRYFPSSIDDGIESHVKDELTRRQKAISMIFSMQALGIVRQRTFFETQNGTLGIGPQGVEVGDVVFQTPAHPGYLLLRQVGKQYVLRGEGSMFAHQSMTTVPGESLQFFDII